jgi:hypothetical protein
MLMEVLCYKGVGKVIFYVITDPVYIKKTQFVHQPHFYEMRRVLLPTLHTAPASLLYHRGGNVAGAYS